MNTAVVYWSGTGNTEQMANAIAEGAKEQGANVTVYTASDFNQELFSKFDKVAFGCPSMGAEVLEEDEFEPMFSALELSGKQIALFGSYGWGDGEWIRNWEEDCKSKGALLLTESLMINETPDDDGIAQCKAFAKVLA